MTTKTTGDFTSEQLRGQACELELGCFTVNDALELGMLALTVARSRELPVAIEVWHTGRLVFKAALPGTSGDNDDWLRRKRNVVERFEQSTMAVRVSFEEKGQEFTQATGLPLSDFAAHGGGWPITVKGVGMVGFFGISGLPQVEDHNVIVECLTQFPSASTS